MMNRFVCHRGNIIIKADLPVDRKTKSGIELPAQKYENRWERDEHGCIKPFIYGEYQIVSGIVLETTDDLWFPFGIPTHLAEAGGFKHKMIHNGFSEAYINVDPPKVGDRVWFPYGIWSGLEASGSVGFLEDDMIASLPARQIYLSKSPSGEVRAIGPYILCEPIPEPIPENTLSILKLSHIKNAGIARVIGHTSHVSNCDGLEVGMAIWHKGSDKLIAPNPFTDSDWMLVNVHDVVYVAPSFVDVPADLAQARENVMAYNNELAKSTPLKIRAGETEYHELDVNENQIDKLAEYHKQHVKAFKKLYRAKAWA
jgi:hypothetical protein